jgi:hypothetical protein
MIRFHDAMAIAMTMTMTIAMTIAKNNKLKITKKL